jgi:hypothetical protein
MTTTTENSHDRHPRSRRHGRRAHGATRQILARLIAGAAVLGVLTAGTPAAAQDGEMTAQATTTVNLQGSTTGWGAGVNLTLDGQVRGVAQRLINLSGKDVAVYCIQYSVPYNESDVVFSGVSRAASGVGNLDRAADIAARSTNLGTTLIGQGATDTDRERNKNYEAAAVQLAIWKHTDNFDLNKVNNTTIRNRAVELANLAGSAAEKGTDLSVVSSYSGSAGSRRLKVVIRSGDAPVSGVTVNVSGGVSGTIVTDGTGSGTLAIGDGSLSVNLSATHVVPTGVVLTPPSGQKVITAASATLSASGVLSVPTASTTTQPPVTEAPVTQPPVTQPPVTTLPKPAPAPGTTGTTAQPAPVTTPTTDATVTTTTLPGDDPLSGVIQEPNSSGKGRWLVTLLVLLLIAFLAFVAVRIFTEDEEDDHYPR